MGGLYDSTGVVTAGSLIDSSGVISVGGAVTEVADWANRGTGSDGDWIVLADTEAMFRYSSTVGEWVRPWVYGGSPTLHARIDGDVEPSTQGWTELTPGSSSISTDGTHVTINGGSSNSDNPAVQFSPSSADHVDHFVTGRFCVLSVVGSNLASSHSRTVTIFTGSTASSPVVTPSLHTYGSNNINILDWSTAVIGTQCSTASATTECYVEIYARASTVEVYHDHAVHPFTTAALASCSVNGSGPLYYIGDISNDGRAAMTVRDLRIGEF